MMMVLILLQYVQGRTLLILKVRRTDIEGMKLFSLTLTVVPLTGKFIKNRLNVFEISQFWISQLSEIDLQI